MLFEFNLGAVAPPLHRGTPLCRAAFFMRQAIPFRQQINWKQPNYCSANCYWMTPSYCHQCASVHWPPLWGKNMVWREVQSHRGSRWLSRLPSQSITQRHCSGAMATFIAEHTHTHLYMIRIQHGGDERSRTREFSELLRKEQTKHRGQKISGS